VASQYEEVEHSALNFPTTGLADENFKQLSELDKRYRDQGLVIIGFPTNQFAGQEPSIQEEILSFIRRKYNVDFEIFQKIDVNGANTHPMFNYLKHILPGTITNDLKWHFTKFLIDRNGNPVKRYAPNESPMSFEEEIRFLLKQESSMVKGMQNLQTQQGLGMQQGQMPIGQAGLQGQIGSSSNKGKQQKSKDWESKDWEKPSTNLQAQSLRQEKDLQGKGKLEQKNLNIGKQGMQSQKMEKDKNVSGGQAPGLTLKQQIDRQLQRERELDEDHRRAAEEIKSKSKGQGLTLKQQINRQLQRERELDEDHRRAAAEINAKTSGSSTVTAQAQALAQAVKDKVMDTAHTAKEKVVDTAQAVKEKMQTKEVKDSGVQAGKDPLKIQEQKK